MPQRPWDRLPAEPDEAYARFLIYRNLGTGRSFRKAYRHYLRECDGYTGGLKRLHVPGSWRPDAKAYFWAERASAWDVRNLAAYGAKVAALARRRPSPRWPRRTCGTPARSARQTTPGRP